MASRSKIVDRTKDMPFVNGTLGTDFPEFLMKVLENVERLFAGGKLRGKHSHETRTLYHLMLACVTALYRHKVHGNELGIACTLDDGTEGILSLWGMGKDLVEVDEYGVQSNFINQEWTTHQAVMHIAHHVILEKVKEDPELAKRLPEIEDGMKERMGVKGTC